MLAQIPATPRFLDDVETFYSFVYNNAQKLNPQQNMLGIVAAQDWPQVEIDLTGGLYLLYLTTVPDARRGTPSQNWYDHYLQWTWVIAGTNIQPTQVGENRSSRWQQHMAILQLLRQAHFPGFCPKQFSTVDGTSGNVSFTTYDPIESITWTQPKLLTKNDNDRSGLIYGSATVTLSAFSDVNVLVNP